MTAAVSQTPAGNGAESQWLPLTDGQPGGSWGAISWLLRTDERFQEAVDKWRQFEQMPGWCPNANPDDDADRYAAAAEFADAFGDWFDHAKSEVEEMCA